MLRSLARRMTMAGGVQPTVIRRADPSPTGKLLAGPWPVLPPESMRLSPRHWLRTAWLELCLRARLAAVGCQRGLRGSGIFGVSRLHATLYRADGQVQPLGLLSTKVITDAGVAFLVDDWDNNGTDLTTLNFHGCGTGAVAENVTDTALGTESTTALNPDNTRATGTRSQPTANQYRTVGTVTFDATAAITEHGIFSQAATGGGTLWDRSVFAAINVVSGESIQFTYTCTVSAGG
jgi:hypothetical protein